MQADLQTDHAAGRVMWLAGVAHASSHSWELIFPAIAVPMALDLGLDVAETMPIAFGLYLLFGLGAPVAGWLADRLGGRRVLLLCLLLGGVSGAGVMFAPTTFWVSIALAGVGFAASLYHPAGLSLLSLRFAKTGRALAINGMAGNVGLAATPFLAGLIAAMLGWRWAYLLLCAPALIFGLVFLLLPFEEVRAHGSETSRAEAEGQGHSARAALALLGVAMAAGGLAYRLHSLVVPALLQERIPGLARIGEWLSLPSETNAGNLAATLLTSAAYTMGMFGQWIGGKVADARPLVPSYAVFHLASVPLIGLAAVLGGVPLVLMLFGYLFFSQGMQPVENSLIASYTKPSWRGRAYASKFILSFGVGSIGAFLVGWLEPFGGLGASLGAAAGFEVLLVIAAIALWRLPRKRKSTELAPVSMSRDLR